jgi:hypothetical protein
MRTKQQRVTVLGIIVGLILALIGIRFWLVPESAALTFGAPAPGNEAALAKIIALRDVWLGLLAVAFALMGEWRALMLWFGFGACVCFIDATIAAQAGGHPASLAFHIASGVLCLVLTRSCWQLANRLTS